MRFICISNGPSVTREQIAAFTESMWLSQVITVNDVWELVEDPDIIYACDYRWWQENYARVKRARPNAELVTMNKEAAEEFGLTYVPCEDYPQGPPRYALPFLEGHITHGHSSAFQALQVAIQRGADKVLLLGYVLNGTAHAVEGVLHRPGVPSDWPLMRKAFETLAPQLVERGIDVVNATPDSSLGCFRRGNAEEIMQAYRERSGAASPVVESAYAETRSPSATGETP